VSFKKIILLNYVNSADTPNLRIENKGTNNNNDGSNL